MASAESRAIEFERLQRRIAELTQRVDELRVSAEQFGDRFRLLTEVTNEAVFVTEDGTTIDVSPECEAMYGYRREELIGKPAAFVVAPEHYETTMNNVRTGYAEPYDTVHVRKDGSRFVARAWGRGLRYRGRALRVASIIDVTEQKRLEEARRAAAVQAEVIRAQAAILDQLSTPLLPISDRVVVLPLIGAVNASRAARVIETLTHGVFTHRAAVAILDITGTRDVDAQVADMLIQAAQAVQLLGARVMLTGIRPDVAQAIVNLGKDLGGIVTHGTLEQGVAAALREVSK